MNVEHSTAATAAAAAMTAAAARGWALAPAFCLALPMPDRPAASREQQACWLCGVLTELRASFALNLRRVWSLAI